MIRMEGGCVAELRASSPCAGLLPLVRGGVTLDEVSPGVITALAPFRGGEAALSSALQAAYGLGFPAAGQALEAGETACIWSGRAQAFLIGPAPDAGLAARAVLTDQSDAWAVVELSGPGAEDVLARLVPLDLRPAAFPPGWAARSLLQHMTVTLWRSGSGAFRIMAFRSMARTLAHEIGTAMALVAARRDAG